MATQFSILAKVKVDTADIQRQLDSLKDNTINIHADTHDFEMSISVANAVMREFVELAESMVEQVYALDTSLTEFKKVSTLRGSGLDEYVEQLGELGNTVARTTSDMVDAATMFRKSGFGDAESAQLAQLAAMYQNIADTQVSGEKAAASIVSQIQAFGRGMIEPMHIIDAYNETANNFAVGTGDLSRAMELSAAGMATYGNTFEEVIGLIVSGSEIMQGRSAQVARGLNTISANIVEQSDLLADYGITVVQANGELTSTYDVLKQLKPVWDELTDAERQSLGQALAGKNQYRVLAAVMQNFEHAVEATETAINSAGSAMRENSAYMESLESKSTLLRASFQTLANDVIPKELIAKGLEALDKVLKILDTDLGVILTRITMLTGIGWGLSSLVNASKILPTIISQFSNFTKLMTGATIVIPKAAAATGGLTAAMATFQSVALPIIGILTALGVGIYAIVKASQEKKQAVDELTKSIKAYDEAVENSNKTLKDTTTETQKTVAIAERYVDRLEALQQKTELTNEEQSEYHAILSNLTTLIPQLSNIIDLQTNSIQGGTQAIRDQIGAWKDLAIQQAYQQKMADVYSAIAEISIERQQRQGELAALEAERGSLVSRQIVLQQQYQTGKGNLQYAGSPGFAQNMHETELALIEGQTRLAEIDRDLPTYTEALDKLNSKLSDAEREAALMQDAVTELMAEMTSPVVSEGSSGGEVEPWSGPSWEKLKEYYITNFPQQIITNLKKLNEEIESTSSASGKTIEEIQEEAEELKFSISEYTSLSESYIDLLESEYDLMNLQGKSEDELISKAKQLQQEYHNEAETLRKVLENSENLGLSTEEIYNIETNINKLSADWWNWQNKINTLLEKAKESTEGIKEDVEDVYDKYMKAVEAERQEEREKRLKERKEWDTYKYWLEQAYKINSYVEQLKASNEELKKQLELQEKLDKLARAKESRVLVYRNGNYEYIQDVDQVSKAAKDLSTYQEEESLEKKINGLLELASAYQTMAEELASGKLGHSAVVAETIKAVEEQGGWRKVFGAYPEETPKTVEEIEINTREIVNNLALIGKKIKVFPYAGGTTSASGGLSLVGERGAELRVLNRGDGILPADLTSNLMRWGQFSPNEFKSNSITGFGSNMSVTIQALNLPNVSDGAGFVEYVRTHMFGQVLNLVH